MYTITFDKKEFTYLQSLIAKMDSDYKNLVTNMNKTGDSKLMNMMRAKDLVESINNKIANAKEVE